MQKQPLFILCICFTLGIFFQDFFSLPAKFIFAFLAFSFSTLCIFLVKRFCFFRLRHCSLFTLFFALGIFAHFLNVAKPRLPDLKSKEQIVFKITKKLNSNLKSRRYEILAWKGKDSFKSVLSVPKDEKAFDFLHYYKAEVYINKIGKPYSDFQFDYGKYLARNDIYFQVYVPNSFQAGKRADLSFSEKIRQKRLETLSKIDASGLSNGSREFTKGIILADRTEMDKEVVQDFSKSGLVHILAISGSHMAVLFWLILLLLNPIFPPKLMKLKIIISLLLIWSFAVFIDYGSSVVRSCVMISVYYTFVLLQRKTDLLHSMAVAAFVILILNTNQLFDVGFQLSFLAVFGIFWFNQPILKYLPQPKNKLQNFLVNIVSISISAQLATLPLVIYYFHQYSLISIIANFVVIPFSKLLIIFALGMTIIIAFSGRFSLLNLIYDFCVSYTLKVIHFFAEVDLVYYRIISMTLLEVLVSFVVIYLLRFAIIKFNIKNILRALYFILIFIVLRLVLNFKASQIGEVLVHQYFKEKVISVKNKDIVLFFMHEPLYPEKIEQYIIDPYLTSRRTKNFEIKKVPAAVHRITVDGRKYDLK